MQNTNKKTISKGEAIALSHTPTSLKSITDDNTLYNTNLSLLTLSKFTQTFFYVLFKIFWQKLQCFEKNYFYEI